MLIGLSMWAAQRKEMRGYRAQAPAWLFAAELREGTVVRLLTPFERTVPILAVRPASRRLSAKVRIFIEHLEKTFALCSQFNPANPATRGLSWFDP
jgi:DNA-binding transcriptional LysR family regulator